MGEVYRARDSRLNRDVAIRVLPADVAADHDRLARFEREAQVLASLNHPNIANIYGVDDSSGTPALVMELVEGPTLAVRIAKGPIPLDEALPIAKQIAEALEAAHEHGIIHCDLKPANIKLQPDGVVKVLDFGLAKALDPATSASAGVTQSPTLSLAATRAGLILGTASYMAPEQARGKTADRRADICASGVGKCARSVRATTVAGRDTWRRWSLRSRCPTSGVRREYAARPKMDSPDASSGSARERRLRWEGDPDDAARNASATARRRGGDATRRRWQVARSAGPPASGARLMRAAPTAVGRLD
jgi:serine/threonine protein kinase